MVKMEHLLIRGMVLRAASFYADSFSAVYRCNGSNTKSDRVNIKREVAMYAPAVGHLIHLALGNLGMLAQGRRCTMPRCEDELEPR
jgi:hypothetical protein